MNKTARVDLLKVLIIQVPVDIYKKKEKKKEKGNTESSKNIFFFFFQMANSSSLSRNVNFFIGLVELYS